MAQLDEMRIYVAVVKTGNFTAAAKQLRVTKQLVSRRVMDLEARLGARLLNRTTRKLAPTESGRVFYERCVRILQEIDEAEQAISNQSGELRGLLRISAPVSFASMVLAPALNAFMKRHPKLEVLLDVDNRKVDIVGEGYDMVIRITANPDEGMVARKLTSSPLVYCCSHAYIEAFGIPESPHGLAMHRCISAPGNEWLFEKDGVLQRIQIHPVLRSNHGEILRDAAIDGLGIAGLPYFYVAAALREKRLVQVLKEFTPDNGLVYILYPQHRQSSVTVRAFADHLQQWFA